MAIDQFLNALFGIMGIVVGAALQYTISKKIEARKHRQEFLELQITGLLRPLFNQFNTMDIEHPQNVVYPDENSEVDVFLKNKEIESIILTKLHLASPKLFHLLLEFQYNTCYFEHENGFREYRSTFDLDGEEGCGIITGDLVLRNYEELKKTVYEEYYKKVILYQKLYGENEKKWSFLWRVAQRFKVKKRKPTKFKIKRVETG